MPIGAALVIFRLVPCRARVDGASAPAANKRGNRVAHEIHFADHEAVVLPDAILASAGQRVARVKAVGNDNGAGARVLPEADATGAADVVAKIGREQRAHECGADLGAEEATGAAQALKVAKVEIQEYLEQKLGRQGEEAIENGRLAVVDAGDAKRVGEADTASKGASDVGEGV